MRDRVRENIELRSSHHLVVMGRAMLDIACLVDHPVQLSLVLRTMIGMGLHSRNELNFVVISSEESLL